VYGGWVYTADLTDRNFNNKMMMAYLRVGVDNIEFFKSPTKPVPALNFDTSSLFFPCDDSELLPNPTEYLKCVEGSYDFEAKQKLIKAQLMYLEQTPENNPDVCVVIESEEPLVRSISSQLICALNLQNVEFLKQAIYVSHYRAMVKVNILDEISMPVNDNEIFEVISHNEGAVLSSFVVFDREGMYFYKHGQEEKKHLFKYNDVMPDMTGTPCGVYYQNLVLPTALDVPDANCCFTFKKNPDKWVQICTKDKYRCIRSSKKVIKKFHAGCTDWFKKNKLPGGPLPPPKDSDEDGPSFKAGMIDEDNGVLKSIMWVFNILRPELEFQAF